MNIKHSDPILIISASNIYFTALGGLNISPPAFFLIKEVPL